jgi:hypothetical protein
VSFAVNNKIVFTDSSAPYEYTLEVPVGVQSLTVTASAVDLAGNIGSHSITFPVVPDPLTTVSGIVVDDTGAPIVGATVVTTGDRSGTTGSGGAFAIPGVPTVRGNIVASANYIRPSDGASLSGSSASVPPVRGGVTNVGTIAAVPAMWEPTYGTFLSNCDDCAFLRTLPFPFRFYGVTSTDAFVGTNGYITFNQGDGTYVETLPDFNRLPRISAFFDDLYGRSQGGMYVNATLPGRFVVTHDRVQHYSYGGSNTLQITLYDDGRILFAYRGITALDSGSITGITPGPQSPFQQVDYSAQPNFDLAAGKAVYEYFTSTNRFDLDNGFILFTPRPDGSYNVRTILPPPPGSALTITGGPAPSGMETSSATAAQGNSVFGNSEVEVLSSGDASYRGMTNTNGSGHFTLSGVPPGGIFVTVRKKDKITGYGTLVVRGRSDRTHVDIDHPKSDKKTEGESH